MMSELNKQTNNSISDRRLSKRYETLGGESYHSKASFCYCACDLRIFGCYDFWDCLGERKEMWCVKQDKPRDVLISIKNTTLFGMTDKTLRGENFYLAFSPYFFLLNKEEKEYISCVVHS